MNSTVYQKVIGAGEKINKGMGVQGIKGLAAIGKVRFV